MELLDQLERAVPILGDLGLPAVLEEKELDRSGQGLLVVDDQDGETRHHASRAVSVAEVGSVIVTTVPSRSLLAIVRLPLFCSTNRLAMARPSPVPSAFVVKNGSDTWARAVSAIPSPVSAMEISIRAPVSERPATAAIDSVPPFGIASRAFEMTSRNACSIWHESTHASGKPGFAATFTSTPCRASFSEKTASTRSMTSPTFWSTGEKGTGLVKSRR